MLAVTLGLTLGSLSLAPALVSPGMLLDAAAAMVRRPFTAPDRSGANTRAASPASDAGRVVPANSRDGTATPERELARVVKALPEGFRRAGLGRLLGPGEDPDEDARRFGYARVRLARMTSDAAAKVTVSFYSYRDDREEVDDTLFVYLSWYKGCWTVAMTDGGVNYDKGGASWPALRALIAHIDEASSKPGAGGPEPE